MTDPLPLALPIIDLDDLAPMPPIHTRSIQSWEWRLWVPGRPSPQGSKVMIPIKRGSKAKGTQELTGEMRMAESSSKHLRPWRKTITDTARDAWTVDPYEAPVLLGCEFLMAPSGSTRTGDWPTGKTTCGDLSHLIRAVEDALVAAGVLQDDKWIVGYLGWPQTAKRYARPAEGSGCQITLRPAVPIPEQWRGFRPPVKHKTPR